MSALASVRPNWPLVAFAGSAALLAGAHAFETFGAMAPCALCLQQREVHWGIATLAVLGFVAVRFRPSLAGLIAALLGLAFLVSVAAAARHVAVEEHWIVAQCETTPRLGNLTFGADATFTQPHCDVAAWRMFGISMAGYNALISLALAAMSFLVALAPPRKKK